MTLKNIFVASLVVALTAFMITPAMATGPASWQHVTYSSVTPKNSQTSLLIAVASDNIPKHTDVLGGFAWFYSSGSNQVFVAVTHNGVRDSDQNPDGWHAHNVQLVAGESTGSDACITKLSDANVGLTLGTNQIEVKVRNSELTGTLSGAAVAFTIVSDPGCTESGLGVNIS